MSEKEAGDSVETNVSSSDIAQPVKAASLDQAAETVDSSSEDSPQNELRRAGAQIRICVNNEDYNETSCDAAEKKSESSDLSATSQPSSSGNSSESSALSRENPLQGTGIRNSPTSTNEEAEPQARSSVIVNPPRLIASVTSNDSPRTNGETKSKPFVLLQSRFASSSNNGTNSSSGSSGSSALKIKLRPSVLKVNENSSQVSTSAEADSSKKVGFGPFRFTPLTNVSTLNEGAVYLPPKVDLFTPPVVSNGETAEKSLPVAPQSPSSTTNNCFAKANSESTFAIASSSSGSGGFVFGQNLEERVTNVSKEDEKKEEEKAAAQVEPVVQVAEKRKYENITGEEDESNVKQIFGKLYAWDSNNSSWKEKGKGNLRLNDKTTNEKIQSRLIMRTSGSLKLILNCLIVHGMKFELTGDCLRFSTVDGIHIFKGKTTDVEQMHQIIELRLRNLPKKVKSSSDNTDEVENTEKCATEVAVIQEAN